MDRTLDWDHREFAPVSQSVRAVREFVTDRLRQERATDDVIDDFSLAVSELASNVVLHGHGTPISVTVRTADPDWWEVEVIGGDPALLHLPDTSAWMLEDPVQQHGRGLGIVCRVMDDVSVRSLDGHAVVRCRRQRS